MVLINKYHFASGKWYLFRGGGGEKAYFKRISSETDILARPLARRRANIFRPFLLAMRARKPCLLTLFFLDGWYVLFIAEHYFIAQRA